MLSRSPHKLGLMQALIMLGTLVCLRAHSITGDVNWSVYMDYEAITTNLQQWIPEHPDLASLGSIGNSHEGRELWLVTLTNKKTGEHDKKPALFVQGGIDSDEVIATQSAMYLLHRVISDYGKRKEITDLLDTHTLYILPNLIPDQSERYLDLEVSVRDSTTRPYDNDNDGAKDEDDQEDIDGDGNVLQMRVLNPQGSYKKDPDDSRIMVKRTAKDSIKDGPFYDLYSSEGIDNDGDGKINEDPVGGVDPNRNWPAHWRQEYQQSWAGPYPLSEIENKNLIDFFFAHSNIAAIVDLHSFGHFLYRPSSVYGDEKMNMADLQRFTQLGELYSSITGGEVWTPRSRREAAGSRGTYGGIMLDWAYDHYGVISFVPELWNFPVDRKGRVNGDATEADKIDWALRHLSPDAWKDWYEIEHPQLGKVELGGWTKPFPNNPAKQYVEKVADQISDWILRLGTLLPQLQVNAEVVPTEGPFYKINVKVSNLGFLPTNVTEHAVINGLAKPLFLTVKGVGVEVYSIQGGEPAIRNNTPGFYLGHLSGWGDKESESHGEVINRNRETSLEILVSKVSENSSITLEVYGQRAGTLKRVIDL